MQATRTFRIFVSSTFPSTWLTCACGTGAGRIGAAPFTLHPLCTSRVLREGAARSQTVRRLASPR